MTEPSSRERRIAEAVAEYLDLQTQSRAPELEEFCRRYPDLADELRAELETANEIGGLTAEPAPPLPERLSGYRILSRLGAGGMGCVYLAEDERLGRRVAVKTLSPRFALIHSLRERFLNEARAMARVSHPNVARIYSLGPDGEPPHFVMEYVEGVPLTESARPLTFPQKAELMRKVALAVEWLHRRGLLHRDLKPANILVGPDLEPKLLDFGLALEAAGADSTRLTRPGDLIGTPDYFSPEQAAGSIELDARSDIFSLGTVMYEVLTGRLPFHSGGIREQTRLIREEPPPLPRRVNPQVPGELQDICMKALEKDPAHRYATAAELAADLERYLAGEPVLAAPLAYAQVTAAKVEQHLAELESWRQDRIISEAEFDAFRRCYDRLS